jgi:hypothetical protein
MENYKLKDAIIGIWHNPTSQNVYCFYPPTTHDGYGEMALLQFKAKMTISFSYKLIQKENQTYLDMDGGHHEIVMEHKSEPILSLVSPFKDTIVLSKGFPGKDLKKQDKEKVVA